jgi:hypothetical protein
MPDVHLPNHQTPQFPDQCLVCGCEHPGVSVTFTARLNGMEPMHGTEKTVFSAAVPACAGCQGPLSRSRWIGKVVTGAGVLVAVAIIYAVVVAGLVTLEGWPLYAALAGAVLGPYLIARRLYTSRFDLAPWDARVVYSFRDAKYAAQFAALNGSTVR